MEKAHRTITRRVDELETALQETIEVVHALYHVTAGEPADPVQCASGICRDALKTLR